MCSWSRTCSPARPIPPSDPGRARSATRCSRSRPSCPTGGSCTPERSAQVVRSERVAGPRVAGRVARREPLATLGAAAVRERLLVDLPVAEVLLDPVVADVPGHLERVVDVGLVDAGDEWRLALRAGLRRVLGPDAGVAVGLQFQ